jgi:hypothetical protein
MAGPPGPGQTTGFFKEARQPQQLLADHEEDHPGIMARKALLG